MTYDEEWREVALSALSVLRMMGVSVDKMLCMTPDILDQLATYERDLTNYS